MFQTGGNLSKYQHEEALLHSKIQTRFKTALYPYLLWNYSITANQPKRAHGVNIATLFLATAMKLESTHTTTPTAMRWGITHACASVSIFVYAYFHSAQTLIKWQRISCGCSNSHHTHSTPICHNMDHRQVSHQVPPPPTPSTCIYIYLYMQRSPSNLTISLATCAHSRNYLWHAGQVASDRGCCGDD